jgi:Immunity protein 8
MPVQLTIADFHSPDVESLDAWSPFAHADVYVLVEMSIGERGSRKRDLFQVMIGTPEAFRKRAAAGVAVLNDRGLILVSEFSWRPIRRHLEDIVKQCEADTWNESVLRLQRFFRWEYEDMVQTE